MSLCRSDWRKAKYSSGLQAYRLCNMPSLFPLKHRSTDQLSLQMKNPFQWTSQWDGTTLWFWSQAVVIFILFLQLWKNPTLSLSLSILIFAAIVKKQRQNFLYHFFLDRKTFEVISPGKVLTSGTTSLKNLFLLLRLWKSTVLFPNFELP